MYGLVTRVLCAVLFVVVSVLAVLYIVAYIIAPKQFKPLWEKKQAELIKKKMSKGKK